MLYLGLAWVCVSVFVMHGTAVELFQLETHISQVCYLKNYINNSDTGLLKKNDRKQPVNTWFLMI